MRAECLHRDQNAKPKTVRIYARALRARRIAKVCYKIKKVQRDGNIINTLRQMIQKKLLFSPIKFH